MDIGFLSQVEENFIKAIYHLCNQKDEATASTNDIAHLLSLKAATVSETLKRLADKGLIAYERYQPIQLTIIGKRQAIYILRKRRLWNSFLISKMKFELSELNGLSEQLEHIHSEHLVDRLDELLGYPLFDPYGDPIPDVNGRMRGACFVHLSAADLNTEYRITCFKDQSTDFLKFAEKLGIHIGDKLKLIEREVYDKSLNLVTEENRTLKLAGTVAEQILVTSIKQCCAFNNEQKEPPCLVG